MNWITTNLRLPEDIYMELKIKAANERKSVAAVIREKFSEKIEVKKDKRKELLQRIEKFGRKMVREYPNLNLTQVIIDARYQQ